MHFHKIIHNITTASLLVVPTIKRLMITQITLTADISLIKVTEEFHTLGNGN